MIDPAASSDRTQPARPRPLDEAPDLAAICEALAAQSDDVLLIVDSQGRVAYSNRELSAGDERESGNVSLVALLSPGSRNRCQEALRSACELGQSDHFESRWNDGSTRAVRIVPLLRQTTSAAMVLARDISDRRRAEESLRESELRFRQLAENVREVFWLMDVQDRRVIYVTNAYQRVWGRSPTDLYQGASRWFDALHPDDHDRVVEAFEAGLLAGSYQAEYRILHADGSIRWIRDRAFVSHDAIGHAWRVAGVAEDITDQRNIEDTLRLERKLLKRLLDLQERERHLLACEIHDGFIQDLVGAKMMVESLRPNLGADHACLIKRLETIEGALRKAIGEGRRMVSNLRPMVIDDKGILAAIDYLINERQSEPGPHMTFSHDVHFSRLPPLLEGAMFRIVQESLNNARRHSQASQVHVELSQVGERVVLTVVDDGVGFNRANVPEGRFGLRGLIERARLFGGRAEVQSEPGCGTRVWVDLPINKSAITL
ncbi:MAG: PAS domain-containing protein [Singulisphaera sp.]